jgi:hypothetical protein
MWCYHNWNLGSSSRLVDEAERVLDAFWGEASVYYSILEGIAAGH